MDTNLNKFLNSSLSNDSKKELINATDISKVKREAKAIDRMIKAGKLNPALIYQLKIVGLSSESISEWKKMYVPLDDKGAFDFKMHQKIFEEAEKKNIQDQQIKQDKENKKKQLATVLNLDPKNTLDSLYDIVNNNKKLQQFISTLKLKAFW